MTDTVHSMMICCTLQHVTPPFNSGELVELHFALPVCGEVSGGGELVLRVAACDAALYMLGDQYALRLRRV